MNNGSDLPAGPKPLLDFAPQSLFIRAMFLIVTGGEPPGKGLITDKASLAERIIAADRGAEYCLDAGVIPHLVVGDRDSLGDGVLRRIEASGIECRWFSPDKDQTDTEIALREALLTGARLIEILGAVGDRFDHTLANVHLLYMAFRHGVPAFITTDSQLIFLVGSRASLEHAQGRIVSFLPLTERVAGIVLDGFAYELDDGVMEIGRPYGVSNVVLEPQASVRVRDGVLLAVMTAGSRSGKARVVTESGVGVIVGHDE